MNSKVKMFPQINGCHDWPAEQENMANGVIDSLHHSVVFAYLFPLVSIMKTFFKQIDSLVICCFISTPKEQC